MVDLLGELVSFPSVSDRPVAPLAQRIADRLDHLGFRVETMADPTQAGKHNLIASAGPMGTDGLLISGHMDVVPTEGQPWSSDPFVLTRRDHRLYGRGTADMKGFIASVIAAVERIGVAALTKELLLVWTYDEEVGCLGSALIAERWAGARRPVPSACLIGEPTGFEVHRMHAGHTALQVTIRGRAAHSSRPDLGLNAIEGAAEVIAAVREIAEDLRDEERRDLPELDRPWVALNIGCIHGGTAVNIVPDQCVLDLGFRPLPGSDEPALIQRIAHAIHRVDGPWEVEVQRAHGIRPLLTPAGTALEALLLPHATVDRAGAAGFATDGGNLALLGTAPLVFGPGAIEVAHKADEWIDERDLHRSTQILECVIRARCC